MCLQRETVCGDFQGGVASMPHIQTPPGNAENSAIGEQQLVLVTVDGDDEQPC